MKRKTRLTLGRLSAPETDAYEAAYAADYLAGQQQDGELQAECLNVPVLPALPAAWERYIQAEELEGDMALRRAIADAIHKNGRVALTHHATGTTAA
jgi:hypothetical protein